jgi:outer membrane protein assembly factor BamE
MKLARKSHLLMAMALSLPILQGCTSAPDLFFFPGVHRIAIQQGNILDTEKFEQLTIGMSRTQVQFVMGTPLIMDSFDLDRWDYMYSLRLPDGVTANRGVTLYFENNQLARVEGEYQLPAAEPAEG